MDQDEYRRRLRDVLGAHSEDVATRLRAIVEAIGENVESLQIEVFPDQDGEGTFDVWARFEGPDSYVLNKPIDDHRHLFGVVHHETGWEPDVPPLPHGISADVLVDTVAEWIDSVWIRTFDRPPSIPVEVSSPDGYGAVAQIPRTCPM
ncbi:hypothetical protein SAMN04489729_0895 [Amycolatopsis lurida]|uniref:Uncharacterized protein n=1 Tax=Amycolatopsis lurida NRRL 2430 TaxID=1460371 RepID=A0A2P2FLX2_AMYLU|nr:DUF6389 family protein [Amycolatopsis lurida]KFU77717.1 hypothetical protein BB31_29045 [Amycolatopsis lurida NRRL 2430]SEB39915.1 hypothetical protein SAMN04489729_0895 [Amycolatopsis lurida]